MALPPLPVTGDAAVCCSDARTEAELAVPLHPQSVHDAPPEVAGFEVGAGSDLPVEAATDFTSLAAVDTAGLVAVTGGCGAGVNSCCTLATHTFNGCDEALGGAADLMSAAAEFGFDCALPPLPTAGAARAFRSAGIACSYSKS